MRPMISLNFALLLLLGACSNLKFTHVTPGQSVEVALARKATPVETPGQPVEITQEVAREDVKGLPDKRSEEINDQFALGGFYLESGKTKDAINAFEKVVKLDPTYVEAWGKLATAYAATGQTEAAAEATKKFKALSLR